MKSEGIFNYIQVILESGKKLTITNEHGVIVLDDESNKRVIKIGGINNGETEQLLHINGGTERTGVANDTKTRRDSERD